VYQHQINGSQPTPVFANQPNASREEADHHNHENAFRYVQSPASMRGPSGVSLHHINHSENSTFAQLNELRQIAEHNKKICLQQETVRQLTELYNIPGKRVTPEAIGKLLSRMRIKNGEVDHVLCQTIHLALGRPINRIDLSQMTLKEAIKRAKEKLRIQGEIIHAIKSDAVNLIASVYNTTNLLNEITGEKQSHPAVDAEQSNAVLNHDLMSPQNLENLQNNLSALSQYKSPEVVEIGQNLQTTLTIVSKLFEKYSQEVAKQLENMPVDKIADAVIASNQLIRALTHRHPFAFVENMDDFQLEFKTDDLDFSIVTADEVVPGCTIL